MKDNLGGVFLRVFFTQKVLEILYYQFKHLETNIWTLKSILLQKLK